MSGFMNFMSDFGGGGGSDFGIGSAALSAGKTILSGGSAKDALGAFKGGIKAPSVGSVAGMAADAVSSFLPLKTEYSGDKGDITLKMDAVYDTISDAAAFVPGVGTAVSGIMKGTKVLGQGINALGGGTDGMTTTDAILGSSLLSWTPAGMINGFGGKKADTLAKDTEAFALTGNSYSGSEAGVNDAVHYSGKKYGAFSASARKRANRIMTEMGRLLGEISEIGNATKTTNELLANQSSMATNASMFELSGGYDMTATRAAKHGMKLNIRQMALPKELNRAIRLAKGGIVIKELPKFNYNTIEITDDMINSLIIPQFKSGGTIEKILISDLPNLYPEGALHKNKHHIEELVPELKGQITTKGIPVVVEGEGGKVDQQAEIEHSEIILNKDLTKRIEKLYKIYYSDEASTKEKNEAAIEAGKYLAEELITNTNDPAGKIQDILE